MKPYHQCNGRLHGRRTRCWHRGVVSSNGVYYCRLHAKKKPGAVMDDALKVVVTKVAEHIVRLVEGSEGRAIAMVDRVAALLLQEVRRIIDEQDEDTNKGKT